MISYLLALDPALPLPGTCPKVHNFTLSYASSTLWFQCLFLREALPDHLLCSPPPPTPPSSLGSHTPALFAVGQHCLETGYSPLERAGAVLVTALSPGNVCSARLYTPNLHRHAHVPKCGP